MSDIKFAQTNDAAMEEAKSAANAALDAAGFARTPDPEPGFDEGFSFANLANPDWWAAQFASLMDGLGGWLTSLAFYVQIGAIIAAIFLAFVIARAVKPRFSWFSVKPKKNQRFFKIRQYVYAFSDLLFPALVYGFLAIAAEVSLAIAGANWLVLIAGGLSVGYLLYHAINRFIPNAILRQAATFVGIPVALLYVFGWLDDVVNFLDSIQFAAGNIRISVWLLIKTALVATLFFKLGSVSNRQGQNVIRSQDALDTPTQELAAKLFQIALFGALFVLALQVLGLDLTALTVFGGALGVGLGFGLQQIASNFISGMILLIERSLTVGDFIELEDGKMGILKELNMRSTTLETYDGKEIMVPNEKFITGAFLNWTKDDPRQRYEVEFSVAYDTDLDIITDIMVDAISSVKGVLQEPEAPDVELRGFDDSGIRFGAEFWINGIDDGRNKISSHVLFAIWRACRDHGVSMPFPQREIRILDGDAPGLATAAMTGKRPPKISAKPAKKISSRKDERVRSRSSASRLADMTEARLKDEFGIEPEVGDETPPKKPARKPKKK